MRPVCVFQILYIPRDLLTGQPIVSIMFELVDDEGLFGLVGVGCLQIRRLTGRTTGAEIDGTF